MLPDEGSGPATGTGTAAMVLHVSSVSAAVTWRVVGVPQTLGRAQVHAAPSHVIRVVNVNLEMTLWRHTGRRDGFV